VFRLFSIPIRIRHEQLYRRLIYQMFEGLIPDYLYRLTSSGIFTGGFLTDFGRPGTKKFWGTATAGAANAATVTTKGRKHFLLSEPVDYPLNLWVIVKIFHHNT
jgi:hypothetical protein